MVSMMLCQPQTTSSSGSSHSQSSPAGIARCAMKGQAVAMRLLHSDGGTSVYMLYVWNIRCHRPHASVCL